MSRLWISFLAAALLTACASLEQRQPASEEAFQEAVGLLQEQRYEAAAAALEPLAQAERPAPGVLVNLAIAYRELGRDGAAREALEAAVAAAPEHVEAHNLLAIQQRRDGRFEDARASYLRVLELEPEHADGNLNLAILCDIYLHDLECAETYYRRYQSLSTKEDKEVLGWIADLERRLSGGPQ